MTTTQKWSGTVTYADKSSLTEHSDSTWVHAMARGTPVSHKTVTLSGALNAGFTLVRGHPDVMASINYVHNTSEDIRSEAMVLCRKPNTPAYFTELIRSFSESVNIAGSSSIKADVSVAVNKKTGKYTITVNAPAIPAKGSIQIRRSELFDGKQKETTPAEPALPSFETNAPAVSAKAFGQVLPENADVLCGSAVLSKTATLTWNLSAKPVEEVKAIHGPYAGVRGDDVTLDGTRSKGKNLTYEWTFEQSGFGGPNNTVKLTGARVKVKLLSSTKVRLKVSDGDQSDSQTVTARIKARDWKTTEVQHEPEKKYFTDKTAMSTEFHTVHFFGGGNRCAEHESMETGNEHYLHPTMKEGWEDTVYTTQQVTDGGPFDGLFYVEKGTEKLRVKRRSWINTDLLPSSAMARANVKKLATAKDFNTLGKQVEEHERTHTTLLKEAVKKNDPMMRIESLVGSSKEDLVNQVTAQLVNADYELREVALNENEVKARVKKKKQYNRSGNVLVPMADHSGTFGEWQIPNFADLGDE